VQPLFGFTRKFFVVWALLEFSGAFPVDYLICVDQLHQHVHEVAVYTYTQQKQHSPLDSIHGHIT